MFKKIILPLALTMALGATTAHADDDELSKEATEKVKAAIAKMNCTGWDEVEVEDNGVIELEDVKCDIGTVDIKLTKDYKIRVVTAD